MVAKTYENFKIIGEPYSANGKMYVKVLSDCCRCGGSGHYALNAMGSTTCYRCGGSGKEAKEVRWYTEAERAALDRAAERRRQKVEERQEAYRVAHTDKKRFGFNRDDSILLFKGDYETVNEYVHSLPMHTARYSTFFGWYIGDWATEALELTDLPEGVQIVSLPWSLVGNEDESLKPIDEIEHAVNSLRYGPSTSEFRGVIGEKLTLDLFCKTVIETTNNYGTSYIHTFEDSDKNVYVWMTKSKCLNIHEWYHMSAKVKDHKEFRCVKQTIINYCRIMTNKGA